MAFGQVEHPREPYGVGHPRGDDVDGQHAHHVVLEVEVVDTRTVAMAEGLAALAAADAAASGASLEEVARVA
ncbi:MAG: DegV family protein, partial [Gammaproteobacteria bacterium]